MKDKQQSKKKSTVTFTYFKLRSIKNARLIKQIKDKIDKIRYFLFQANCQ